mgnify:CR=1 FL=1
MGHLRTGYACGILTGEELNGLAEHWIAQAQIFNNWVEFAISVHIYYLDSPAGSYHMPLPQAATSSNSVRTNRVHSSRPLFNSDCLDPDFCNREIRCHRQYLDFVGFWEGSPSFDMAELNREALEYFQTMRDFSAQFYPIVGRAGLSVHNAENLFQMGPALCLCLRSGASRQGVFGIGALIFKRLKVHFADVL